MQVAEPLTADAGPGVFEPSRLRRVLGVLRLLSRRSGTRNVALNLAGNLIPVLVAGAAFPIVAKRAGIDRLGLMGLAWTVIGYLGLLDLGFARVVVRRVALIHSPADELREAAHVSRILRLLVLGVTPMAAIGAWLFPTGLVLPDGISASLAREAALSFRIIIGTLPFVVVTGILRGVLEGRMLFGRANALKAFFGVWNYVAPALVALVSPRMPAMVAAVAAGRVLGLIAHYSTARRVLVLRGAAGGAEENWLRPLLREGGWLTVSNVVGPLMVTFDRFAVSSVISLAAVGYYLVPQEMALRLLLIPMALASTVFPMLSRARGDEGPGGSSEILKRSVLAALAVCLPMCVVFAGVAELVMSQWMSPAFARQSGPVAAILAVGLLANCLAQIPYASIQAAGRADVTAKLHLFELPAYLFTLWHFLPAWGIRGAAFAWTLRAVVDAALLYRFGNRLGAGTIGRTEARAVGIGVMLTGGTAAFVLGLVGPIRWVLVTFAILTAVGVAMSWLSRLSEQMVKPEVG